MSRTPEPGDDFRVVPQLGDLMRLSRSAARLPSWNRSVRARTGGTYLSSIRGRGMEYDESRLYQPGDDVRTLDWRVTARTGKPHTKLFREERERPVFVMTDFRAPMFFGSRVAFKAVVAARAASLLIWKAQQNSDRIGALVFGGDEHGELEPRRGRTAALHAIKLLSEQGRRCSELAATPQAGSGESLNGPFARLRRLARPGSLVFMLSDFRGLDDLAAAHFTQVARHCDVFALLVYDPLETQLPERPGDYRVTDGARTLRLETGNAGVASAFQAGFEQRAAQVERLCVNHRAAFRRLATSDEPFAVLHQLLGG